MTRALHYFRNVKAGLPKHCWCQCELCCFARHLSYSRDRAECSLFQRRSALYERWLCLDRPFTAPSRCHTCAYRANSARAEAGGPRPTEPAGHFTQVHEASNADSLCGVASDCARSCASCPFSRPGRRSTEGPQRDAPRLSASPARPLWRRSRAALSACNTVLCGRVWP